MPATFETRTSLRRFALATSALAALAAAAAPAAVGGPSPARAAEEGSDEEEEAKDDGEKLTEEERAEKERKQREQARKYRQKAVRYVRAKNYDEAFEYFEKALPWNNDTSDIFFNLVNVGAAIEKWSKVYLYASGFLHHEPEGADAKKVRKKRKKARKKLKSKGTKFESVAFRVEPEGLTVFVDDAPVGKTGGDPIELPGGRYEARVTKPDHHPWEKEFEVVSGAPIRLEGELEEKIYEGQLMVKTEPEEGVTVYVDDDEVATTPMEEPVTLKTRRYLVRLEKEGWDKWVRYVEIERNETHTLEASMER